MRAINPNLKFLHNQFHKGTRGVLLEGSSRSGKTYSGIDWIVWLCSHKETSATINIIKESYNSFKTTLYDDFNKRLPQFGIVSPFADKQEVNTFRLFGNKINLLGADNASKFHGASCDYFWCNEVLDIPRDIFDQSEMRCRKFWWCDFNPKYSDHWLFDRVASRPDVSTLKTTFKDNPFISEMERRKILSYEPTETNIQNGTADEYQWNVYGLGLRSAPEGLIFQHVTWLDKFPQDIEHVYYGLDFGYSSSPSALMKVGVNGQNMYIEKLHYGPTESANVLLPILRHHVPDKSVWADSADPGLISDCRRAGLKVFAVKKFPGSINYGISLMKKYKIHIVDCPEMRKEQSNYKYREIRGIRLDEPIDDHNHGFDACFSGDTMVTTHRGQVRIDSVNRNDFVLTSIGFQKIVNTWSNGIKQTKEYLIRFDTHLLSLRCTEDHKIKTSKGWKQISQLRPGMMVYLNSSLMAKGTGYILGNDISAVEINECIGSYGNTSTGLDLKAITYIIKMVIHGITNPAILNWYRLKSTVQNIPTGYLPMKAKTIIKKFRNWPSNGMAAQVELSGTKNTLKIWDSGTLPTGISNASNVEKHLLLHQNPKNIATRIVRCRIIEVSEKFPKEESVFDIQVANIPEYFANGVLVHNCRYAAISNLRM